MRNVKQRAAQDASVERAGVRRTGMRPDKTRSRMPAILILLVSVLACSADKNRETSAGDRPHEKLRIAVEYNTHAAAVLAAQEMGLFAEEDLFDLYVTGTALAGALSKGEIDAAYICLVPAIVAHANGGVAFKIVCGTHRYGYGLVVNRNRIRTCKDLEKSGLKVGCVNEGAQTDILLHQIIAAHGLQKEKVMANILRMNPAKQVMALRSKQLDAILVPEHFAALGAAYAGNEMLMRAQDVWPGMQGSVLLVTEKLLKQRPQDVQKLFEITAACTRYLNEHPGEAAEKVAHRLNIFEHNLDIDLVKIAQGGHDFAVSGTLIEKSMRNLEYTTELSEKSVQETIDLVHRLGYIKKAFPAREILLEK